MRNKAFSHYRVNFFKIGAASARCLTFSRVQHPVGSFTMATHDYSSTNTESSELIAHI